MRNVTIYSVTDDNTTDHYLAVIHMLRSQRIEHREVVDAKEALARGRGRLNPEGPGFVVALPNNEYVYDSIALAMWIDRMGFKLLA